MGIWVFSMSWLFVNSAAINILVHVHFSMKVLLLKITFNVHTPQCVKQYLLQPKLKHTRVRQEKDWSQDKKKKKKNRAQSKSWDNKSREKANFSFPVKENKELEK